MVGLCSDEVFGHSGCSLGLSLDGEVTDLVQGLFPRLLEAVQLPESPRWGEQEEGAQEDSEERKCPLAGFRRLLLCLSWEVEGNRLMREG